MDLSIPYNAFFSNFLEVCGPSVLHIATHGYYLPSDDYDFFEETGIGIQADGEGDIDSRLRGVRFEDPYLRSGLALAGANTWVRNGPRCKDAGNGLMTADDVAQMDLTGTDLVVLSACDTGVGQLKPLEGVMGLRTAFGVAGARILVVSLWKIPDEETAELMVLFYRNRAQNQSPAKALKSAQLVLRDKYPDPYRWAAFVSQGG